MSIGEDKAEDLIVIIEELEGQELLEFIGLKASCKNGDCREGEEEAKEDEFLLEEQVEEAN